MLVLEPRAKCGSLRSVSAELPEDVRLFCPWAQEGRVGALSDQLVTHGPPLNMALTMGAVGSGSR